MADALDLLAVGVARADHEIDAGVAVVAAAAPPPGRASRPAPCPAPPRTDADARPDARRHPARRRRPAMSFMRACPTLSKRRVLAGALVARPRRATPAGRRPRAPRARCRGRSGGCAGRSASAGRRGRASPRSARRSARAARPTSGRCRRPAPPGERRLGWRRRGRRGRSKALAQRVGELAEPGVAVVVVERRAPRTAVSGPPPATRLIATRPGAIAARVRTWWAASPGSERGGVDRDEQADAAGEHRQRRGRRPALHERGVGRERVVHGARRDQDLGGAGALGGEGHRGEVVDRRARARARRVPSRRPSPSEGQYQPSSIKGSSYPRPPPPEPTAGAADYTRSPNGERRRGVLDGDPGEHGHGDRRAPARRVRGDPAPAPGRERAVLAQLVTRHPPRRRGALVRRRGRSSTRGRARSSASFTVDGAPRPGRPGPARDPGLALRHVIVWDVDGTPSQCGCEHVIVWGVRRARSHGRASTH